MVDGKALCTWVGDDGKLDSAVFALDMLDTAPAEPVEDRQPHVPTREEILAAGYKEAAVEGIISRQQALLNGWNAARPAAQPAAELQHFSTNGRCTLHADCACRRS